MFKLKIGLVAGLALTCLSTVAAEPDQPSQIVHAVGSQSREG